MKLRRMILLLLPPVALIAGYAWFALTPAGTPVAAEEAPLPGLTSLPVEPSAKPTRAVPRYDANGKPRPVEPLPPLRNRHWRAISTQRSSRMAA